jgi:hypothetical protein
VVIGTVITSPILPIIVRIISVANISPFNIIPGFDVEFENRRSKGSEAPV